VIVKQLISITGSLLPNTGESWKFWARMKLESLSIKSVNNILSFTLLTTNFFGAKHPFLGVYRAENKATALKKALILKPAS